MITSVEKFQLSPVQLVDRGLDALGAASLGGSSFEIDLPDGRSRRFGHSAPTFRVSIKTERGLMALAALDEELLGRAYLDSDLDIHGSMLDMLSLRTAMSDWRPLAWLWATFGEKLVYGQTDRDKKWISEHYDIESDFYLLFLDPKSRCYSHGYFESDDESLERATQRKLDTAMTNTRMKPGFRVLDIGAGWGAFTQHAGQRGVNVTSLTISVESERYVNALIAREGLPCRVLREHFLEHRTDERYDAIVNLGVTEHLPDYEASLKQYARLLKPGGRLFLDACSSRTKFPFSSFTINHVWPGNATPLQLPNYIRAANASPFELISVNNDRRSYMLTTRHWAENLERRRDEVVRRWGERQYRRFLIYLWGCVHSFQTENLAAFQLLFELPSEDRSSQYIDRGRVFPPNFPVLAELEDRVRGLR